VQEVVAGERLGDLGLVDQSEAGRGAGGHRDRRGAVQPDHRGRRAGQPRVVQAHDLPPVGRLGGRRLGVDRGDRGLELVRPEILAPERPLDQRAPLGDPPPVPPRPVLVLEGDERAVVVQAGLAAAVLEQHQREQPLDLGDPRQQLVEHPREPDRLRAQVRPDQRPAGGRVALVEHQVQHRQHRRQALRQLGRVRDPVRDAGVADLGLGPDDALGDGRLGDQEAPRDLGGRQAAQRPQGQRDLGARAPGGSR
jgi:hypothetical protein